MIIALCGLENQTQSLIASLKSPSPIFFFFTSYRSLFIFTSLESILVFTFINWEWNENTE